MREGQIDDRLDLIFTEEELAQIVTALKNSYFSLKNSQETEKAEHVLTALQKIGWVIDEDQPKQFRTLRDYEV
jgi:hypothetical protein